MLVEAFLTPSAGRPPVIFFLDDEEMERLWPDLRDPAYDLTSAVRRSLNLNESDPFRTITASLRRWELGDVAHPVPCLPLLAVTVLAATRMRNDNQATSSAYYLRLAQLLWRESDPFDVSYLRDQLTDSFPHVARAWRLMHDWVSLQSDELGPSTIRSHPTKTHIGYPLSQALIRGSDRDKLSVFFEAIPRDRVSEMSTTALLKALAAWNLRPRGFSAPFCRVIDNPAESSAFGPAILALLVAWNGEVVSGSGRKMMGIRLRVNLEDWTWKPGVRLVEGLDEDTYQADSGGEIRLHRPDYGDYYTIDDPNDRLQNIRARYRYKGKKSTLVQDASDVWILRVDLSSGEWISESSVVPYQEHVILVHSSIQAQFDRALTDLADDGWRRVSQKVPLVPNFSIFSNVSISDPSRLDGADDDLPRELRQILRPEPPPVPTLVGGLPLASELGRYHYLVGGAPSLLLPVGPESQTVETALDGVRQADAFRATGFPIPLHTLPLEEGRHNIAAGGLDLEFYLHNENPAGGIWSAQFNTFADDLRTRPAAGPSVMVRHRPNATHWLVLPDGSVHCVLPNLNPPWVEKRALPTAYYQNVPGEFAWHLVERDGLFTKPQMLRPIALTRFASDPISSEFWRRVMAQDWEHSSPDWQHALVGAAVAAWAGSR